MNSIRGKMLFWFGGVLAALLFLLGVITYSEVKNTVIPLTQELSQEVLVARSGEMGRLMEGYLNEVRATSRRNLIRAGDFFAIGEDLASRSHMINGDYEMLFYADPSGDYITTTGARGNVRDREYFKAVMEEGHAQYLSAPVVSRASGEYVFVVACPVINEQGDKTGLVAATVLLDTLSDIAASIKIGENGFGYVVEPTGLLVAHPNEGLRMALNLLESSGMGYVGLEEVGGMMVAGEPGISTYQRPDGSRLVTIFHPIPHTPGWSLGISLYESELMGTAAGLMQKIIYFMVGIILAVLLVVYLVSGQVSSPVMALHEGVKTVSSGNLDYKLDIETGDEIQQLASAFNQMTGDLKDHIKVLQQTTAEKERIESELQVANKIQGSMLPRLFPPFPDIDNLDLYATMEPAREVGGDFYDFFLIDDHRLFFSIGDVSGKGVGAALFMVITRTILKNQAMQGNSLPDIFYQTNNLLCFDNVENMFVSVFMGVLDLRTGELEYISAGHNPPLLSRGGGKYAYLETPSTLVLGGLEDYPYPSSHIKFEPGDMLFLYTDGVTEAMNDRDELFSEDRMFQVMDRLRGKDVRSVIRGVRGEIDAFVQGTPASDDVTMLILTLTGEGKAR